MSLSLSFRYLFLLFFQYFFQICMLASLFRLDERAFKESTAHFDHFDDLNDVLNRMNAMTFERFVPL
jgi:hypothetical protein